MMFWRCGQVTIRRSFAQWLPKGCPRHVYRIVDKGSFVFITFL